MLYIDQHQSGAVLLFPADGHAFPAADQQPEVRVRSTVRQSWLTLEGEWSYPSEDFWAFAFDAPAELVAGEWEWALRLEGKTLTTGILVVNTTSVQFDQYEHKQQFTQYGD